MGTSAKVLLILRRPSDEFLPLLNRKMNVKLNAMKNVRTGCHPQTAGFQLNVYCRIISSSYVAPLSSIPAISPGAPMWAVLAPVFESGTV